MKKIVLTIILILFAVLSYSQTKENFIIKRNKNTIEVIFKNYYIVDKSSPKTAKFVLNKSDLKFLLDYTNKNNGEAKTILKEINQTTKVNLYIYKETDYCELYFGVEGEDYEIMSYSLSLADAQKILTFK